MLDAGAGTGFTTEGIVARVDAADVTMLDQSPAPVGAFAAPSPRSRTASGCSGDAENLPFADDAFDRYVSAGSIEYWPDPQRGIAEAYRVVRTGGRALVIGPVRPANRVARALAETWMLFPAVDEYRAWMEAAGFDGRAHRRAGARLVPRPPRALRARDQRRQAAPGPVARAAAGARRGAVRAAPRFALRFVAGSAAGALFIPLAIALTLRDRVAARRARDGRAPPRAAPRLAAGAARVTIAATHARANPLAVLWRFARPHTIIGTALSVVGLCAIAARATRGVAGDLAATLLVGLMVNIAIVGVNQITDVEIDRINKPFLPIAAGELSLAGGAGDRDRLHGGPARAGGHAGGVETVAVAAGLAVGALYSLPPFRLKRFPVAASLCITGVRSLVVNLGVYWHFAGQIDPPVWALCLFVLPFSFAIAVLKDVPDIEGDRRVQHPHVHGPARRAAGVPDRPGRAGARLRGDDPRRAVRARGRRPARWSWSPATSAAAGLLWYWARAADPRDRTGFTRFYMRVWALFFLEYLLVPIACLST